MSDAPFQLIDGFRCYAPELAGDFTSYPSDGFDVTADLEHRSFWVRSRNRVLRQVFRRFVDLSRPLDVLEIGCGIGGVLGELRKFPNLRLTGSEIYLHGLRYARTRVPGVEFIQLDATRIPFESAYDVIGAFDVIEHITDDSLVLRQVHRALRPGGLFVVTVPQYPWMWSQLDELVEHKRRYTRRELLTKLEQSGFETLYSTSFVTTLFPLMMARRLTSGRSQTTADVRAKFTAEVSLPRPLNALFDAVMRVDEALLRAHLRLPFGGTLLAVVRRRESG